MAGIFANALTGLNAAQLGLHTTEHNVANANTPGYSRQRILQTTQLPVATGSGFLGQGTRVTNVERQYDAFLARQVNQSQTRTSELSKYFDQVSLLDNIVADPQIGLSPALQDFYVGLQQVAANPSSVAARQSFVSAAQALATRFQSMGTQFEDIAAGVDRQIASTVAEANSVAAQIGELNERILIANAATGQLTPNDLLDQRDQLVLELNKLIRVQVVNDPNGSYNLFIGNGQQLVVGPQVQKLATSISPTDNSRVVVGFDTPSGFVTLPDAAIVGGDLGGLVAFRREALDTAFNGLGQIATSLALTFNAQHALGQDLLGQIAGTAGFAADFFVAPTATTIANANNASGAVLSASLTPPVFGADGFYTNLTASDYKLVANGGGNFTLTRNSDGKVWGPAALGSATAPFVAGTLNSILNNPADPAYAPQGFTLAIAGAPVAGESFVIQPVRSSALNFAVNSTIASDPRLVAAALPIRVQGAATNLGSGKVVASDVGPGYIAPTTGAPITLSFGAAAPGFPNGSLAGFPPGTTVTLTNAGALNGNYAITALTDRVPYQTGATIAINHPVVPPTLANALELQIDGLPGVGDRFVIERNVQGVSDGRNALRLGQLQTQNTLDGATATTQSAYARLVAQIGSKTHEVSVTRDAQEKLLAQSVAAREAVSGVNLDEEAASLVRYQQAYQAAAKSLQIASTLFDEILALGR